MQVGRDAYAGMLRSALANCGVDTSLVSTVDGSSGTAIILLQPSGALERFVKYDLEGARKAMNSKCSPLPWRSPRQRHQLAVAL